LPDDWRAELVGHDGFVSNATLAAAVRASDATLLPYRMATQSGAVVVAQALGSVPIATAVGGIPEQIEHGLTGVLMQPDAAPLDWIKALQQLGDDALREAIAARARKKVEADHAAFVAAVQRLAAGRG
jgi:glycosyltransferase involved in cell wall biosynthesis